MRALSIWSCLLLLFISTFCLPGVSLAKGAGYEKASAYMVRLKRAPQALPAKKVKSKETKNLRNVASTSNKHTAKDKKKPVKKKKHTPKAKKP